jgi:hypothetical protein
MTDDELKAAMGVNQPPALPPQPAMGGFPLGPALPPYISLCARDVHVLPSIPAVMAKYVERQQEQAQTGWGRGDFTGRNHEQVPQ